MHRNTAKDISWRAKYASVLLTLLVLVVDYLAVVGATLTAYNLRRYIPMIGETGFIVSSLYIYVIVPLIFIGFLYAMKTQARNMPFWIMLQRTFWSVVYSLATITMLMYLAQVETVVSRLFVAFMGLFAIIFIWGARFLVRRYIGSIKVFRIPVLFVGAGLTAERVVRSLDYNQGFSYQILGFLDDSPISEKLVEKYGVLGGFADAERIIRETGVREVIITAPGLAGEEQIRLVNRIQPMVDRVLTVPDLIGVPMGNLSLISLVSERIIMLNIGNNLKNKTNRILKRLFDIIISLIGVIIISPLLLLIALLIYLEDKGGAIYAGKRVGRGGREFPCYKFRSMVIDNKNILDEYFEKYPDKKIEWERNFKLQNDPRLTKIGAFIRRTSLDELPQLINVIKGDMSLVGPRPLLKNEIERYGEEITDYYYVLPGITGLWQISGRSDTTFEERSYMDSWYVRNWSIWLDIFYLFKTIGVVLGGKGAY